MLKPDDLLAISFELKAIGLNGMVNDFVWLAKCPNIMTDSFKRHLPECYNALKCPIREVPKLLNHQSTYIPIIAKYRLTHGV